MRKVRVTRERHEARVRQERRELATVPDRHGAVAPPVQPDAPSVSTPSSNKGASARAYLKDSRGSGYTQLEWETNAGSRGLVSCGCAENATKAFSVTGLGTSQQRMRVRVYNGESWSPWSGYSNSYQPYGDTLTPSNLRSSRSGDNITWTWGLPTNGRSIDQVEIDGAANGTYGGSKTSHTISNKSPGTYRGSKTSHTISNKSPGTYRLRVRAHSAAGWSAWTAFDSATIPQPSPSVTVHKGTSCGVKPCVGTGSCSTSSGAWIAVKTANFGGSVTCSFKADGQSVSGWRSGTWGANQDKDSSNFYGYPGTVITATCGGVSDSMTWN